MRGAVVSSWRIDGRLFAVDWTLDRASTLIVRERGGIVCVILQRVPRGVYCRVRAGDRGGLALAALRQR